MSNGRNMITIGMIELCKLCKKHGIDNIKQISKETGIKEAKVKSLIREYRVIENLNAGLLEDA